MKLADYVADFLAQQGVGHVFLISGGAIIHCIDSVASHPKMTYICTQHEQAAGAAADAYARVSGRVGCAMVTSGPGGTNLLTSICNAYFDSIPVIFICGQVATFRLRPSDSLRQKGFQETDVTGIFKSVTKYAVLVKSAEDIRYELEKALYLAREGRPGPVVLDIPDDLQRVDIDPEALRSFKAPQKMVTIDEERLKQLADLIKNASRPLVIAGAGIRLSGSIDAFKHFVEALSLPFCLTWGGMDIIERAHPLHQGPVGVCGPRSGNFAAQNADLIISIGTRLSQMITGGKPNLFAPGARKVMIDIDPQEIAKFTPKEFVLDCAIQADLPSFFAAFRSHTPKLEQGQFKSWQDQIKVWAKQYPICPPENYQKLGRIDAYVFMKRLSALSKEGDLVMTDAGGNLSWTLQAFDVKKNQRLISAWNHSPMGYALPGAMGATLVNGQDSLCIIGDGGIMMCLQELGTIRRYNMPVKIFIMNNLGHGIQKQTIETWLNSRYVAVDQATGLYFPSFERIAQGFDLPFVAIDNHQHLDEQLRKVLAMPGPVLCDVAIDDKQRIIPMLKFGAGLEDLSPPLSPSEIEAAMQISRAGMRL